MLDLLRYKLSPPLLDSNEKDVRKYMVISFIDAVRECMKTGGFLQKKEEQESGGNFLVAWDDHLFQVWGDFQVAHHIKPYIAVGAMLAAPPTRQRIWS